MAQYSSEFAFSTDTLYNIVYCRIKNLAHTTVGFSKSVHAAVNIANEERILFFSGYSFRNAHSSNF